MTDKREKAATETEAQARAREAGDRAQAEAEDGTSGDLTASEAYSGAAQDGEPCEMTDGRMGVVHQTGKGKFCVVAADAE